MRSTSALAMTVGLALALTAGCGNRSTPAAPTEPTTAPRTLVTILDVTDGLVNVTQGGTGTWNWGGQSFTMPSGGPFNNIRFNWYTYGTQRTAAAFGTLYLLTEEYLGLAGSLGASTAGFVAKSASISDGQYVFPSTVTLNSGKKYWCYTDTQGAFSTGFDTDTYAGGDLYVSGHPTVAFHKAQASWRWTPSGYIKPAPGTYVDADFRLMGSPSGAQ